MPQYGGRPVLNERRLHCVREIGGANTQHNNIHYTLQALSNHSSAIESSYTWKIVPMFDVRSPRAHFSGRMQGNGTTPNSSAFESPGLFPYTVNCSIEDSVTGRIVAGYDTSSTSNSLTMSVGVSDVDRAMEFNVFLKSGRIYYLHVHPKVSASQGYPLSRIGWNGITGNGWQTSVDYTMDSDRRPSYTDFYGLAPVAFTGIPVNSNPVVIHFLGDSTFYGFDGLSTYLGRPKDGYLQEACWDLGIPYMLTCSVGISMFNFHDSWDGVSIGNFWNMATTVAISKYATHSVGGFIINDISNGQTDTQILNNIRRVAAMLKSHSGKVGWVTGLLSSNWNGIQKTRLFNVNSTIRSFTSQCADLDFIIDAALGWETSINSGVINPGYSSDGSHPNLGTGIPSMRDFVKGALTGLR